MASIFPMGGLDVLACEGDGAFAHIHFYEKLSLWMADLATQELIVVTLENPPLVAVTDTVPASVVPGA